MDLENYHFATYKAKGLRQESPTDEIARVENLKRNGSFT